MSDTPRTDAKHVELLRRSEGPDWVVGMAYEEMRDLARQLERELRIVYKRRDINDPKLYARRDHQALGEHYLKHLGAMTAEDLHAKSDIAAELAYRDAHIEHQERELAAARAELERAMKVVRAGIFWKKHDAPVGGSAWALLGAVEEWEAGR